MPSLSVEKHRQCACHDGSDGQPTASRTRSEKTRSSRWNLERDRHRCLGDLDRSLQMCRFLQVSVGLTLRQVELSRQTLHGFGQWRIALKHGVSGV
jgi:hypothetical protein